jgi:hypothetical protein
MERLRAKELIRQQLNILEQLQNSNINSEAFQKWKRNTRVIISKLFGENSKHVADYSDISFWPGIYISDEIRQQELNRIAFQEGVTSTRALFSSLIEEIGMFWESDIEVVSQGKTIEKIFNLFNHFRHIAKTLQNRYHNRETIQVNDEYDVQDLLHALLKLYFDDIRTEEWTPSYAGGSSRMDFLLKNEQIVIEVKKTREGLKDKHVGEQLIIDKAKYKSHQDCKKLICFVYDPEGRIGNPASLEKDLSEKSDTFEVCVVIRPKD